MFLFLMVLCNILDCMNTVFHTGSCCNLSPSKASLEAQRNHKSSSAPVLQVCLQGSQMEEKVKGKDVFTPCFHWAHSER